MSENKIFTYLNYSRDGYIGSFYLNDKPITTKEVCDLLKEQEEEITSLKSIIMGLEDANARLEERIKELETRNKRQYNLLTDIIDLMMEKNWKGLEKIVENQKDKRIKELETFIKKIADDKGEIVLFNGYGYNIREVIKND